MEPVPGRVPWLTAEEYRRIWAERDQRPQRIDRTDGFAREARASR